MMNRTFATSLLLAATLIGAGPAAFAKTLLFKNGVVHTVSGDDLADGQVLVTDGKITRVAKGDESLSADETVDLKGGHLYPGLINASGTLGLVEIDMVRATRDMAESGEFTPEVQAWVAVNPDSELIRAARANGVTHTIAVPEGGIVSGQSGLIQLGGGWTMEDLKAKGPAAMHLFWPSMALDTTPKEQARDKDKLKSLEDQAKERRFQIKEIEDFFSEAEAYAAGARSEAKRIPAWEALIPVVRGELPLVIHADSFRQIKAALKFAAERKYRVIIAGGRDAAKLAKELAAQNAPVIFERVYNDGNGLSAGAARDTEPYDAHFATPGILAAAGVKIAISGGVGGEEASNVRNIPFVAAQAMAFGLPRAEALRAITLNAAEIYGVNDRLGSIEAGKEATLFIASGDILDIRSQVRGVWIKGTATEIENHQTRLFEKYRSRPKPIK